MQTLKDLFSLLASIINWKLVISILLAIILGVYGYTQAQKYDLWQKFLAWLNPEEITEVREPTGTLYASLAKLADSVGVMSFDLSSSTQSGFRPFINYPGTSVIGLHTIRDTGNGSAALFSVYTQSEEGASFISNIAAVLPGGELQLLLPEEQPLVQIRHLTYSEESDWLAFSAQDYSTFTATNQNTEPTSVNSRSVYITSPSNQAWYYLAPGSSPNWSPDGNSLVYLAADSLKQYDFTTGSTTDITLGAAGTAFGTNMNMKVSEDGSKLALTSPNQAALYVGDITNWSPLTIENLRQVNPTQAGQFPKAYYWPVFSPDAEFLAVQSTDIKTNQEQINARVDIIDLQTDQIVKTIPITDYDFTRAFLDEWDY